MHFCDEVKNERPFSGVPLTSLELFKLNLKDRPYMAYPNAQDLMQRLKPGYDKVLVIIELS